jgi:thiopeptide-type bacteriocin biosynthesis protein
MVNWSYVKILHDPGPSGEVTDIILCKAVLPFLRELYAEGLYTLHFFLRYSDETGPHLRLRLNAKGLENRIQHSLGLRLEDLAPDCRIVPGCYEPELAKYGGPEGMHLAECQFHASSEFAFACLACTERSYDARLLIGAREMSWLIEAAMPKAEDRATALAYYVDHWRRFLNDPRVDSRPTLKCDSDMRAFWIEMVANDGLVTSLGLRPSLIEWRNATSTVLGRLIELQQTDRLSVAASHIALNFVHTFNNRLGLSIAHEILMAELLLEMGAL